MPKKSGVEKGNTKVPRNTNVPRVSGRKRRIELPIEDISAKRQRIGGQNVSRDQRAAIRSNIKLKTEILANNDKVRKSRDEGLMQWVAKRAMSRESNRVKLSITKEAHEFAKEAVVKVYPTAEDVLIFQGLVK